MSKPKLIGITGGIGSGKSTVCKIFSILGVPVYTADDRAKWLMTHDPDLKNQLISHFGQESYLPSGQLNRSYLAEQVFSDPEQVKVINGLVHPAVKTDFERWASTHLAPYVLKVAALIFETGGDQHLDAVITVSSPLKIRMARVLIRDQHRSEAQINEIINQQLPDEVKNERADFVIKNTDNKLLIPQVLAIHDKLSAQS